MSEKDPDGVGGGACARCGVLLLARRSAEDVCLRCAQLVIDVDRARTFGVSAHGNQMYGDRPYSAHLEDVYDVLALEAPRDAQERPELLQAAWLHDTLEDTETEYVQLLSYFGPDVAELVWAVSGGQATRWQSMAQVYDRIGRGGGFHAAATLKLADRIANVRASAKTDPVRFAMYRDEAAEFEHRIGHVGSEVLWQKLREALAAEPARRMTSRELKGLALGRMIDQLPVVTILADLMRGGRAVRVALLGPELTMDGDRWRWRIYDARARAKASADGTVKLQGHSHATAVAAEEAMYYQVVELFGPVVRWGRDDKLQRRR